MAPTIEAVREVGADLGIVLDTDVDRSGVVDRSGEAINRNRLIAFLATVVLRDSPGTTVVTDSTTSNGLKARSLPSLVLIAVGVCFPCSVLLLSTECTVVLVLQFIGHKCLRPFVQRVV